MRMTRFHLGHALVTATLLSGGLLTQAHAQAVVAVPAAATQPVGPDLSAQGHAEIKVPADIATLTLSVASEAKRETAAAQANAASTTALIALIRAVLGPKLADKDIQTADYTSERQFNTNGPVPVLIGYQVTNTVLVTLHDVGQVSRLIDLSAGSGATKITGLTYSLVDRQAVEARALTAAVMDARGRAQAIAAALGATLGSLRSVNDSAGSTFQPQMSAGTYDLDTRGPAATPISPQEIMVTADVTLDYGLTLK